MKLRKLAPTLFLTVALSAATCFAQQFSALLYTKTNGWHHDSVNAGVTAIQELGELHDFSVTWSEHTDRYFHDEGLKQFDVVIFLLTTGDVLNEKQQAAFQRFVNNGGGYVGIHSAADTEYDWDWYTEMVGHMFHIHPAVQTAVMKVEDPDFPGMDRFAPKFIFTDEWYEFDAPRSDELIYLLSVDEKTYKPEANWGVKKGDGMGDFHPISWYRNYDGGRAFYTGMGHMASTYSDKHFMHHVYGGIYWAATGNGFKAGE